MNKIKLVFCILLMNFLSFGQDHKFGVSMQLNSPSRDDISLGWYNIDGESIDDYNLNHKTYSSGILLNYNINEETTIRMRYGMTKYFIDEYKDKFSSGTHSIESNKGQQTKLQFAPGIIWKINNKKLVLFAGFEIPINMHGQFNMDWIYSQIDSITGIITNNGEQKVVLPKGNSFGFGAIMGFNYFPAKWFSLGAEISPSLLYANLSGKTTTVITSEVPTNQPITYYSQDGDKGFTYYEQRFSINISFWFGS